MLDSARILILEDDVLVGLDLATAVSDAHGIVVGPFPSVGETLAHLRRQSVSAAIVDFMLIDRDASPVVELLASEGIPLIIYTGNDLPQTLRQAYPDIPVFRKSTQPDVLLGCLVGAIQAKQDADEILLALQSEQAVKDIAERRIAQICETLQLDADYFETRHLSAEHSAEAGERPTMFEHLHHIAEALRHIPDPLAREHLGHLLSALADEETDRDLRSRLSH